MIWKRDWRNLWSGTGIDGFRAFQLPLTQDFQSSFLFSLSLSLFLSRWKFFFPLNVFASFGF